MATDPSTTPSLNESADNKAGTFPDMDARSVATVGSRVILEIGDREVFATLLPKGTFKVPGAGFCTMQPLIGAPFGSHFEVVTARGNTLSLNRIDAVEGSTAVADPQDPGEDGPLEPQETDKEAKDDNGKGKEEGDKGESARRDNRNLLDRNNAQTLSAEDIMRLKSEGVTGDRLVEALKSNSATFATKTEFSQEKYLKKKKKKHCLKVILRRATAPRICEAYFKKGDYKAGHVRVDALSLLLSLGNVFAGAATSVLVFESCAGLITGAVAERMGGLGSICSTYPGGKKPSLDIAKLFDMDHSCYANIVQAPMELLRSSRAAATTKPEPGPDAQRLKVDDRGGAVKPAVAANESAVAAVLPPSAVEGAAGGKEVACAGTEAREAEAKQNIPAQESIPSQEGLATPGTVAGGSSGEPGDATPQPQAAADGRAAEEGGNANPKGQAQQVPESDGAAPMEGIIAASAVDTPVDDVKANVAGLRPEPATGTLASSAAVQASSAAGARDRHGGGGREPGKGRASGSVSRLATPEELQRWGTQGFTSLVVATENALPLDAANALLGLLQPSAPFVFLHSYLQPLADCMLALQISRRATGMQIIEPWMREYQVLPSRTHPHMAMSGTGGYLLSGYVTASEPAQGPASSMTPNGVKKRGRF